MVEIRRCSTKRGGLISSQKWHLGTLLNSTSLQSHRNLRVIHTISLFTTPKMLVSVVLAAVLAYIHGATAVPANTPSHLKRTSNPLLQWTPPSTLPQTLPAFQAKIDWDLDKVSKRCEYEASRLAYQHFAESHNSNFIWSPLQLVESRVCWILLLAGHETDIMWDRGYWYDTNGQRFGEILRANDDGIVTPGPTPGTQYLELRRLNDARTRKIPLTDIVY